MLSPTCVMLFKCLQKTKLCINISKASGLWHCRWSTYQSVNRVFTIASHLFRRRTGKQNPFWRCIGKREEHSKYVQVLANLAQIRGQTTLWTAKQDDIAESVIYGYVDTWLQMSSPFVKFKQTDSLDSSSPELLYNRRNLSSGPSRTGVVGTAQNISIRRYLWGSAQSHDWKRKEEPVTIVL